MIKIKQRIIPYLFISPFFVMLGIFMMVPLGYGFWMSLNEIYMGRPMEFVGLVNFLRVFSSTKFYHCLKVTALYTLGQGSLHLLLALGVALMLNLKFKGRMTYRSIFFLPVITSFVVAAMFWRLLLDEHIGLINTVLKTTMGLPGYKWLEDSKLILPSVIFVGIWRWFGFQMIILLAGLQSIPSELYDAAKIDGATSFQTTRYVTLPLLFPVVFFCIAIILIGDFMLFDIPFILLGDTGGTGESALSLAMYLYRSAFLNFKLGYGAALGYVFALLVIGVSLLYVQALGKKAGLT